MIGLFLMRLIAGKGLRKLRGATHVLDKKSGKLDNLNNLKKLKKLNKPNIGRKDRMTRALIGTTALAFLMVVKNSFMIRYLLGLAALAGLVTAYTKYSPVYTLIGEDTRKKEKK